MNFYIVGHIVNDRAKTDALIHKLHHLNAKKILPALWVLKASGTVRDLEGELKTVIDMDDTLFVAEINSDCQYRNMLVSKVELQAFFL